MALAKYRLKGHESFILREGWITKALFAIDRDPLLFTVSAGADALGVGTNMAKSIRYWMRTAGLTDESQATGVHLTELGRTILQCDPYLEDIFTLWIIHINIATNYKLATSWNAGITCQTPAKKYGWRRCVFPGSAVLQHAEHRQNHEGGSCGSFLPTGRKYGHL